MSTKREPTAVERLWVFGDLGGTALIIVGAFTSVVVGVPGAVVMLAGLALSLGIHLGVGVVGYRRVMARDWPKVRPLDAEDDW